MITNKLGSLRYKGSCSRGLTPTVDPDSWCYTYCTFNILSDCMNKQQ